MLLNAAKYQGYSFYHFGVIKGKTTGLRGAGAGEGSKYTPNTLAFFFKKLKILWKLFWQVHFLTLLHINFLWQMFFQIIDITISNSFLKHMLIHLVPTNLLSFLKVVNVEDATLKKVMLLLHSSWYHWPQHIKKRLVIKRRISAIKTFFWPFRYISKSKV